MSPPDYIQNLVSGDVVLDELALLIVARVLNIHCVVLMADRYWSTKSDGSYENCLLKLAFTGNSSFKELTSRQAQELAEVDEDLEGTGLVDDGNDSQSEGDSDSGCSCEGSCDCSNPSDVPSSQYDSDSDDPSVIVLSSGEVDVSPQPINLALVKLEPSEVAGQKDQKDAPEKDQEDTVLDISSNNVSDFLPFKMKRVERKDPYVCYICTQECTLQSSYLKHMKKQHPNDPLKCEKCSAMFNSPNGLMKHIRSHSYMKYKCDVCYKRFQFPYQINDHLKMHTGAGLYGCEHCDKKFASRNLAKAHEKSHAVSLKCPACPDDAMKRYSSKVNLKIHARGMHGQGWFAPCGKNCKWKSMYACHIKKCKICIKKIADFKMNRYDFMRYIDVDSMYSRD